MTTRISSPTSASLGRVSRKGHGQATLADVAALAGVSPITVSRAIRTPDLVAARTRERVQKAVSELGYIPNRLAGNLASSASTAVAAILPTLDDSIFTSVLKGMAGVIETAGLQLVLGSSHWDLKHEESLVETFLGHRVSAIVLTGARHSERTRSLLGASGTAVIETWSLPSAPIGACVGFSNQAAAYAMTKHLIDTGYRDIAFVSAPVKNNDRATGRRRGYARALADHGLDNDPRTTLESRFQLAAGGEALERILEVRPSTDAIFFANDVLASGAVLHAFRQGMKVPDDVAIAGFDDLELAAHVHPALSTVRVDRNRIGAAAGDLVLAALRGEDIRGNRVDVGFEVVVRGSTWSS